MYTAVIIDDEPWTRSVIKSLGSWKELDIRIVGEASDGQTGWLLIEKVLPDIVITDVRMPGINGLDLIGIMRNKKIDSPAIIISGYDDYDFVHKALKLGVVDYLLKPIRQEELNRQLENCIAEIRKNSEPAFNEVRAEFIPEDLEKECQKIMEDVKLQLQLWKKEEITHNFLLLENEICLKAGENPPQSMQIGIYYEVLSVLQKYLDQMGFQGENSSINNYDCFVFGRNNTIHDMICFFIELFHKMVDQIETAVKKKSRIDTDAIVKYLKESYAEPVTLEQTAEKFHISKEYLSKIFKADHDIGFSDFILKLRMERAGELITVYDVPLKEIGFLVGYSDLAHFYKTFKKYYGITPGDMRNSLKIDNEIQ